jgi:hypothetical protein
MKIQQLLRCRYEHTGERLRHFFPEVFRGQAKNGGIALEEYLEHGSRDTPSITRRSTTLSRFFMCLEARHPTGCCGSGTWNATQSLIDPKVTDDELSIHAWEWQMSFMKENLPTFKSAVQQ